MNYKKLLAYYYNLYQRRKCFIKGAELVGIDKKLARNYQKSLRKYSVAKVLSNYIYDDEGYYILDEYGDEYPSGYIKILSEYKTSVCYYPEYWFANNLDSLSEDNLYPLFLELLIYADYSFLRFESLLIESYVDRYPRYSEDINRYRDKFISNKNFNLFN